MGVLYYLEHDKCSECGRFERTLIGKSSVGCVFALHVSDTRPNWETWKNTLLTSNGVAISMVFAI